MKPRNKHELRVETLSAKLPGITDKQKRWAFAHCFDSYALRCKDEAWCTQCGGVWVDTQLNHLDKVRCPYCGKDVTVTNDRRRKYNNRVYLAMTTRVEEFQVIRYYVIMVYMRKGEKPHYTISEAVQIWINEHGRETIVARPCKPMMYYNDAWDLSKPMEIRMRRSGSYYSADKYSIICPIYPWGGVLPILKRNGFRRHEGSLPLPEYIKLLLNDREAEILAKNDQYDLLYLKWTRGYGEFRMPYPHAIRIAMRNKYFVRDASMWVDYLGLLTYFGLDTHNAHYVCPRDLKAEHDKLLKRKRRKEAAEEAAERMRKAALQEEEYKEAKGRYFGICFGNERITVAVITSVAEIAKEGETMHHCVFECGYHKKAKSLILSARIEGKPIETVEVNLETYKVVQSRGVCNKSTEYHEEIIGLVNANMHLIRAAS